MTFQATIPTLEHCLSLVELRLHNITLCRRDMIFYIFQLKRYFSTLELGFTPYLFRTAVKWFVYFFFLMLHCDRVGSHFVEQFKNEKNTRAHEI